MLKAQDVAAYFLSKDKDGDVFTKGLIERNGRTLYEGNARLNKYLHMAQNLYIAKTGTCLFQDDMYAYDNGAVVPAVQRNFSILLAQRKETRLGADIERFLDLVYKLLENATIDELIELSHEDQEWRNKSGFYQKQDQRMDQLRYAEEYKKQYADALRVMQRMEA